MMWSEREFLAGTRAPVRDTRHRKLGYHIIYFPSVKNRRQIICEGTIEAAYCVWLEWDSDVKAYYPQPYTFSWHTEQGRRSYTPDFYVMRQQARSHFTEVKSDFDQLKNSVRDKLNSFIAQCEIWNLVLRKADKQQVMPPHQFANLQYLYFQSIGITARERSYSLDYLEGFKRAFTLRDLLDSDHPPSLRAIYRLMFEGVLEVDLAHPLTINSLIQQPSPE